jgi:hypothetical protein
MMWVIESYAGCVPFCECAAEEDVSLVALDEGRPLAVFAAI